MLTIKTILELLAIVALLYGYWREDDIIAWEQEHLFNRNRKGATVRGRSR